MTVSTLTTRQQRLMQTLANHRMVKVIAGIDNTDWTKVEALILACNANHNDAITIDVAADEAIVRQARALTDLPLFASSVEPQALANAITWGADAAELGNYDALYKDGFYLNAAQVIELTEQTLALLPEGTPFSVTIPGHLSQDAQVQLARQLEALGVTMIQTEGACNVVSLNREVTLLDTDAKAALTLANTQVLSQVTTLPLMTASGITSKTLNAAFAAGASAVGIGSAVNTLNSTDAMSTVIAELLSVLKPAETALVG